MALCCATVGLTRCHTRNPLAVNLEDPAVVEPLFELFHGTADDDSLPEEVGGWGWLGASLAGCAQTQPGLCLSCEGIYLPTMTTC